MIRSPVKKVLRVHVNNLDDKFVSPIKSNQGGLQETPKTSSTKKGKRKTARNAHALSLNLNFPKGKDTECEKAEKAVKDMTYYLVSAKKKSPDNDKVNKLHGMFHLFFASAKGPDATPEGLYSQSKREERHTTVANIRPPVIGVDNLMNI